jgi:membrane protease YdiL (CAAX protease family)
MNPENNWKARNAWQCWLALVLLELVITIWLRIAQNNPASDNWLLTHEYSIQCALKVFRVGLWLSVAFWFSGAQSVRDFIQSTGLSQKPTLLGWWGAWIAIGIGFVCHFGVLKGWSSPDRVTRGFINNGGANLVFYVVFVISAGPFFEEVVFRGFLYRALRGSYGRFLSTVIVLCMVAWFHWSAVIHSSWTTACFSLLGILLCVMRERTGSVWNCVLGHAAYNAAGILTWPYYIVGMILLLPYCAYGSRSKGQEGDTRSAP